MPLRIVMHGAAGRMGQRVLAQMANCPDLILAGAMESSDHPKLGEDAGTLAGLGTLGVPLASDLPPDFDVAIDFSVPDAATPLVQACAERQRPVVVATTGFSDPQENILREAARIIPLVWAPSMSPAVNLALKLSQIAAQALASHPSGADVEIIERHHRYKVDAPSGTALAFGRLIAEQMGQSAHSHGRSGHTGVRSRDEIGYHAVRGGDNPGEHTILFAMLGESLEITVKASNRDCYAIGALAAAQFVVDKPPGIYSMQNVLGL